MRSWALIAGVFVLLTAPQALAQVVPDLGAELRLQNELRWQQGQIRALEAEVARMQTDATLRRLQSARQPDARITARMAEQDAIQAEALLRGTEAASTARAAGLRAASPVYDRRLRELGYATGLPVGPGR
jgi:hypothetical protein